MAHSNLSLEAWRDIGVDFVRSVGARAKDLLSSRSYAESLPSKSAKGPVYRIDHDLEDFALQYLSKAKLPIILNSEDGPGLTASSPEKMFLLDPLDGSTNAVRGIPYYSVSLAIGALELAAGFSPRWLEVGIVYNICSGQIFTAIRNQGSYRDAVRIVPSRTADISAATLGAYLKAAPESAHRLADSAGSVRALGSIALELCNVADGTFDAFVDVRYRQTCYDIAAGVLIAETAGAVVDVSYELNKSRLCISVVACNNGNLRKTVLDILQCGHGGDT